MATALGSAEHLLLHFSGCGYGPRDVCQLLVNVLRSWKQSHHERRLITLFHEVFATGPIWRSSFGSTRRQQRITQQLVELSDFTFVTSHCGYRQLKSICSNISAEILLIFSTIGGLRDVFPLSQKSPFAFVFGSAARRRSVYSSSPLWVLGDDDSINVDNLVMAFSNAPAKKSNFSHLQLVNLQKLFLKYKH